MLYREIIAVCSQIHRKHINKLCGQNVELLNVKPGGTYSDPLLTNLSAISASANKTAQRYSVTIKNCVNSVAVTWLNEQGAKE